MWILDSSYVDLSLQFELYWTEIILKGVADGLAGPAMGIIYLVKFVYTDILPNQHIYPIVN